MHDTHFLLSIRDQGKHLCLFGMEDVSNSSSPSSTPDDPFTLMNTAIQFEDMMRSLIVREAIRELFGILENHVGWFAAREIQRVFRGHSARKRVRLRRKRLLHTILLLQRISRGGFARRNAKLLRLVDDNPPRRRLVLKYRSIKGEIGIVKTAAAFFLQRFARRIPSIVRVQHIRDQYVYIQRCCILIQAVVRRFAARRKYGSVLLERKRARHEKLLNDFILDKIKVRRLLRVELRAQEAHFEQQVCRVMREQRKTYEESVQVVKQAQGIQLQQSSADCYLANSPYSPPYRGTISSREVRYSLFCNNRRIVDLGDRDTSDSEDDSIDEELLRPPNKAVKLVARRKKKNAPNTASSNNEPDSLQGRSSWILRTYPGTPPPAVRPLTMADKKRFGSMTPSPVKSRSGNFSSFLRLFDEESSVSETERANADVFSRVAHHWF